MSNNLRKTLELIADMNLIPLRESNVLYKFPNVDLTFNLPHDLDVYEFRISDKVSDIFEKYFKNHKVDESVKTHLISIIDPKSKLSNISDIVKEFTSDLDQMS